MKCDIEYPIGFNPLSRVPDDLKPIVADGVVCAFRHVWPERGPLPPEWFCARINFS
jgi:hypothetical protein